MSRLDYFVAEMLKQDFNAAPVFLFLQRPGQRERQRGPAGLQQTGASARPAAPERAPLPGRSSAGRQQSGGSAEDHRRRVQRHDAPQSGEFRDRTGLGSFPPTNAGLIWFYLCGSTAPPTGGTGGTSAEESSASSPRRSALSTGSRRPQTWTDTGLKGCQAPPVETGPGLCVPSGGLLVRTSADGPTDSTFTFWLGSDWNRSSELHRIRNKHEFITESFSL